MALNYAKNKKKKNRNNFASDSNLAEVDYTQIKRLLTNVFEVVKGFAPCTSFK